MKAYLDQMMGLKTAQLQDDFSQEVQLLQKKMEGLGGIGADRLLDQPDV